MNEENRERLSAFMDDELSLTQSQRLLDTMKQDGELRRFWQSGHLIAAAMRRETLTDESQSIAGRVRDALAAEPAILAPTPGIRRRILGPLGGMALAASVAVVAIIATRQSLVERPAPQLQSVAVVSAPAAAGNSARTARFNDASSSSPAASQAQRQQDEERSVALTRMTWNDAGPAVEARLNAYLLKYNEFTMGGVRGMLPYARIVGYGPTK